MYEIHEKNAIEALTRTISNQCTREELEVFFSKLLKDLPRLKETRVLRDIAECLIAAGMKWPDSLYYFRDSDLSEFLNALKKIDMPPLYSDFQTLRLHQIKLIEPLHCAQMFVDDAAINSKGIYLTRYIDDIPFKMEGAQISSSWFVFNILKNLDISPPNLTIIIDAQSKKHIEQICSIISILKLQNIRNLQLTPAWLDHKIDLKRVDDNGNEFTVIKSGSILEVLKTKEHLEKNIHKQLYYINYNED